MTTYDFVHLVLLAAGDKVRGRTKLQKLVYFAGQFAKSESDLGYRPHYYGPYSPDVAGAVQDLRALRFLDQQSSSTGAVDTQGFEVSRYDYVLTEDGKRMAEEKARLYPDAWEKIQTAVRLFAATDYVKLSIAAKTFFLVGQAGGTATVDQLQSMTSKFGWAVSGGQIVEAAKLLSDAGLIHMGQ